MGVPDAVVGPADPNVAEPLKRLPDAQVFARDAEDYDAESEADVLERLRKVVERKRRARRDDADVVAKAAKMKKVNAAAAKKKAKVVVAADPMETVL